MGSKKRRGPPADAAPWYASIPRRNLALGGAGVVALLAIIPGWAEHSLVVRWKLAHGSRGGLESAAWPRLVARPAFVGEGRFALPWHAATDGAEAPSGVRLYEARRGTKPALALVVENALAGGRPLLAVASGEVRGRTIVVTVDAGGAVACLDGMLNELWSARLDAAWFNNETEQPPYVALALEAEAVVVFVAGRAAGGAARVARLRASKRGEVSWVGAAAAAAAAAADFGEPSGAPPRSSWEADAGFWGVVGEAAYRAPGGAGDALEALAYAHLPFAFRGAEDAAIAPSPRNASLYVARGPSGLDFFDAENGRHAARAPLPRGAWVGDVDGDGAADSVKCVDFDSAAPRHRKAETSEVAACAAVGVRGLPPVERFFEASLCHDRGVERDTAKRKADRSRSRWKERRVHSALPLDVPKLDGTHGADLLFAVSRGILTRVDVGGDYRWQTRHGPTWNDAHKGGHLIPLSRGEVLLVGSDAVAIYDAAHGAQLARLDLPVTWDDERVQHKPVLSDDESLLLVVTNFHTFGVALQRKFSVGAATTKLAVFVLVAIAVFFIFLAAGPV